MDQIKILIIEDDSDIREAVRILLVGEGYRVSEAANGREGLAKLEHDTDLVILDVMMPGDDGVEVCSQIRQKSNVPVLFLTAKRTDADRFKGLMAGGDDYLGKPFSFDDLLLRVRTLIRRYRIYQGKDNGIKGEIIEIGNIRIDETSMKVFVDEQEVRLTDTEYRILDLMMRNPHKVFSAQQLYETIWNEPYLYSSNGTIMVHIRKLRTKIEKQPDMPEHIKTVWSKGYQFE